jgi:hypothetical protein
MALITDSGLIDIRDLLPFENDLLETADKERVELSAKTGLAVEEVRHQVEIELDRAGMEATSAGTAGFGLRNVVVTDTLRWWMHCHALYLIYLEAYGHQLNERFKAKQLLYAERAAKAKDTYLERGVGVVGNPLPRPAAPAIAAAPGTLAAANYYVAVSWVGANGRQSGLSPLTTFSANGLNTMSVNPNVAPGAATGWHVYVGSTAENLARQSLAPIAPGQVWVMTTAWNAAGPSFGAEQQPDVYLQPQRVFPRG